jgi:hypothetical protein
MVALVVPKYSVMLLACPQFGSGRRGFGCPNPACLSYRYASGKWESVDLSSILIKRLRSNMSHAAGDRVAEIKSDNGHLSAATTSNARCQNLPWAMDFADVEQAFDQSDCVNRVSVVLINERNEPGAEK